MSDYPNLELLEYKVRQGLMGDSEFVKRIAQRKHFHPEFTVDVFSQVWGSTCLGFDVLPDGSPTIGGCAMTRAYTSVFHELDTDVYVVCFGDRVAYEVSDPGENFLCDLRDRALRGLREAQERY